jgi:ankyrin repeat protein
MDANSQGLFQAARYGDIANVRKYLDLGTNIDVEDYRGLTSLQIAGIYGHLDIVRLLLDRGANIEAGGGSTAQTALILASLEGELDVVKELLDRGANMEAADNLHGWNSLMLASWKGKLDVVKELVRRGANIFAKNSAGVTARQIAYDVPEVEKFLREKEQAIGRMGLAERVVKYQNQPNGKNFPTVLQKKIVEDYLGGRKKRTKRKLTRRKKQKQQKGTRRR